MTSPFFDTVVPDIGLHIASDLTAGQREGLLQSLITSLPYRADVRAWPAQDAQRIGIWLRPPTDAAEAAARQKSLGTFAPLNSGDTFAAFLRSDLLNELNGGTWSMHSSVLSAANAALSGTATPERSVLCLLPAEILLPGGLKLIASYHNLATGVGGVTASGTWSLVERRPSVTIVPPAWISAEFPDLSCMAQIRLRGTDLRPPLLVSWSAAGLVANPGARSTPVLFNVHGARPAQVVPKAVAVCVTDADGLNAEARTEIQVQVTWGGSLALPATVERILEQPV